VTTLRLAIVQSMDGQVTCCGPDEFREQDHSCQMDAALSYHLEAGRLPAAAYWVNVELPPLPEIPELRALVERGEFPRSFLDSIIEEGDPMPALGPSEPPATFGRFD
jgi:hypothetical protein